jgi:hypothetical protein
MSNDLINFYTKIKKPGKKLPNPGFKDHGIELPFRMLVVGASGGGKTRFTMDLLSRCKNTFNEIILSTRSVHEPLYEHLLEKGGDAVKVFEGSVLPNIDDWKNNQDNVLAIIDDFVDLTKKQIQPLFAFSTRGRKYNLSTVFQTQSYFDTPKMIRLNCDYVVITRVNSEKDWNRISREYSMGLGTDDLKRLYSIAVSDNSVLLIDVKRKQFRKNYQEILYQC